MRAIPRSWLRRRWRVDYDGGAFVRRVKKEPFNGYLEVTLNQATRRYTSADIEHLFADILPRIGERLRRHVPLVKVSQSA